MSKPLLLALALMTSGCLEGDFNPYAEPAGGGGGFTILTPGATCSQMTNVPVSLSFNNRSPYTLRVYWVDFACQEVDYGTLAPGGVFSTSTSANHRWRLREVSSNALAYEYVTESSPTQSLEVQVR